MFTGSPSTPFNLKSREYHPPSFRQDAGIQGQGRYLSATTDRRDETERPTNVPFATHGRARPAVVAPRDTIRLNETPEGVDLGLRPAGPTVRALALAIDGGIRLLVYLALTPLAAFAGLGAGMILITGFLLEWFYPVVFEIWTGATPGKRALGLLVVHDDGTPVGLPASLIRNLLRVIDFLPLFYGAGLVCTLADRDFRRLGDLAAGTLVVHAEDRMARPAALAAHRDTAPRPPPAGLSLTAAQAILAFDERAARLSAARRIELAETLLARFPPAADGQTWPGGPAAVALVASYAHWLTRGR